MKQMFDKFTFDSVLDSTRPAWNHHINAFIELLSDAQA